MDKNINNNNNESKKAGYYNTGNSTVERYTPLRLFQKWNQEFHFTTDPCADPNNHLGCKVYFTKDTDGLANVDKWKGAVFINPPYNKKGTVEQWIKAALEHNRVSNEPVVMLLKATPGISWFQKYVWDSRNHTFRDGIRVRFLPGRIKFTDSEGREMDPAPFESMLLVIVNKKGGATTNES
jgi:phage N-6-adenine-methyltransferase